VVVLWWRYRWQRLSILPLVRDLIMACEGLGIWGWYILMLHVLGCRTIMCAAKLRLMVNFHGEDDWLSSPLGKSFSCLSFPEHLDIPRDLGLSCWLL
jgi:hypothetical protein